MGKVFQAWDTERHRKLALKVLKPGISSASLAEEFRLLSRLSHPNLVEIFDYHAEAAELCDLPELNGPCFTMELLAGRPLDALSTEGSAENALKILGDAAAALHYLHSRNILHRDLKPSNLVWESGRLRLLDFGLASAPMRSGKIDSGTPAYLPPEAFWGEYGTAGDLFALGVTLYEWLAGRPPFPAWPPAGGNSLRAEALAQTRPDLPGFLSDLLDRLLELSPGRRPSSALSLLQFLHRHGLADEASESLVEIPSRLAWQGPEAIAEPCRRALRGLDTPRRPFLAIVGPSGSGRSRLLEELRWEFQLEGGEWFSLSPREAPAWRSILMRRFFGEKAPLSLTDSLSRLLQGGGRRAVALEDLQEWPEPALRELRLLLEIAAGREDSPLFFFDLNSDLESPALREWREHFETFPQARILELPELSEVQARALLDSAPLAKKPSPAWIQAWLERSGGRPILLMEGIRQGLAEGFTVKAASEGSAPERLRESCRHRLESLSPPARKLFAAFLTGDKALDLSGIAALEVDEDWEQALAELDRKSLLRLGPQGQGWRCLAQPSLRTLYLEALSREERRSSHARWLLHRMKGVPDPEKSGALASALAEHAAEAGERELAKAWGLAAATYHENREEPEAALACYQRLLPFAESAEDRYVLQGSMAPLFHRLGRYAEAREAYAKWFADRPDDETRLQKAKFHLFSGMVEFAAGDASEARGHFVACLEVGPLGRHPSHHPYHARALNFLAALERRAGRPEQARLQLEKALSLSGDQGVLRGEIEQRLGELEQSLGRFTPAFEHFRRNLEHFQRTKNPQSEAVSYHLLALWAQDYGRLAESEGLMNRSLDLAKAGGATLQSARYLQNRALLRLEMARYGEAWEDMSQAGKVLRVYGSEEELNLSRIHRAEFHSRSGNRSAATSSLGELAERGDSPESRSWWPEFLYQRAQHSRREGEFARAEADLMEALRLTDPAPTLPSRLKLAMARLGLAALGGGLSQLSDLLQSTLRDLSGLEGKLYPAWRRSLEVWSVGPERLAGLLPAFLAALQALESPETRRELAASSSLVLGRRGLIQSADFFWQMQIEEGRKIAATLPEEIKMEYEKNLESSSLDEELKKILGASQKPSPSPASPQPEAPPPPPATSRGLSELRFRQFSEISRQIAGKDSLAEVLERVMDAAIELTGAERGFLLLENPKSSAAPLPGFEVKTARHFNQQSLGGEELQISMTAVRQAMERGSTLLSANAQLDERLKDKRSVVQYQLKSILAVPLELEGRVLGAIYLDHRYSPDCFREEDVILLDSFSAQAALAVQKARFIAELKHANAKLEEKVESQAQRIEVLSVELAQVRDELRYGYDEIVGQSPKMMEVFHLLDHVSDTLIPVWIYGESGTGKELIARSLHENSARKKGPLVTINCSAIPETLLESELFGHKRGAFTHADRDRIGLFEQANRGTLFMDEVADMSMNMQVKLLRVLQEGEVRPLGASKTVKVDVRLVTASNKDLQQWVAEEKFRQDLFFRINGITIPLPPLRERKEDIPLLVNHLIQKLSHSFKLEASKLSEEAYEKLVSYSWPGNIRQLESVLRNALLFAQGGPIGPHLLNLPPEARPGTIGGRSVEESTPKSREKAEERRLIIEALRRHRMDKAAAAKDLDVTLRCLYMRMDRHGIPKNKSVLAKFLSLKT